MKVMTCLKSVLLLPHELLLTANNHSTEAGDGLCSPLFDLVQIVFSVRLVGVQVVRLPLRLQAACYCFPTDEVWEPAAMCHSHFTANVWKHPDLLIKRWYNLGWTQNPVACFSTFNKFENKLWPLWHLVAIYWQVSAISLPVRSSFAFVFHYRVAETQRSIGSFVSAPRACWLWISQNNRQGTFWNKWTKNGG